MEQYICIHGHFYQPPRENPWLETIELQDGAYPYHDWNERITAECYAPNTAARILGKKGLISRIVNNYAGISFDFGPTLLSWMERSAPDVYQAIIASDRKSRERFSGHGSAMAQAYSHLILPLANPRDKHTQVLWGIRDFEYRFGRPPEGMWLPEAAADLASLDIMAGLGIQFVLLAPHQALRVRASGGKWEDVSDARIDTTIPYRLTLPSKHDISVFFYNGPISRAVAFEGLLNNGEQFAGRLVGAFQKRTRPQLVHIATDGETYGHHHRYGEMALAYLLHYLESKDLARITNYGEYLEKHPPTQHVEIKENTSWSCNHGIERWRSNCGCNSGAHPGWNQDWRTPLREALDWLRDHISPRYEEKAKALLKDPWAARNSYIDVVLDRSLPNVEMFLAAACPRQLGETEKTTVLKLLELARQAMLMYTSDGWFFDDISGIETVQIMQYAGRAIQLAESLFAESYEPSFLEILERAQSNIPELGNGRRVYEQLVRPAALDLPKIAANFAISSLFEEARPTRVGCYDLAASHYQSQASGNSRLATGLVKVTSAITLESARLGFGVLHLGNRRVSAGVREYQDEAAFHSAAREINGAFASADFAGASHQLSRYFGTTVYSLSSLFRDEQRRVLEKILEAALTDIQATYRQLYAQYYPPLSYLTALGKPNPLFQLFHGAAGLILNFELRRALSGEVPDTEYISDIMERVTSWQIELDTAMLAYRYRQTVDGIAARFAATPPDLPLLIDLATAVSLARSLPFGVDLWQVQNVYHNLLPTAYLEFHEKAAQGDGAAVKWLNQFLALGGQLSIEVTPPETA